MVEIREVTHQLSDRLGDDTRSLTIRVGLNSGTTTAGVLRGDKGRFQLFGDTVNTASRLESSGQSGRIHVSEDTAICLKRAGKANWLFPREDKVTAKGKGELVTYWLLCNSNDFDNRTRSNVSGSNESHEHEFTSDDIVVDV